MRTRMLPILKALNEIIFDESERDPQDKMALTLLIMARADLMAARARMQFRDVTQVAKGVESK